MIALVWCWVILALKEMRWLINFPNNGPATISVGYAPPWTFLYLRISKTLKSFGSGSVENLYPSGRKLPDNLQSSYASVLSTSSLFDSVVYYENFLSCNVI